MPRESHDGLLFCTQNSTPNAFRADNFDRPVSWPMGQLLTRHGRHTAHGTPKAAPHINSLAVAISLAVAAALVVAGCRSTAPPASAGSDSGQAVPRGGELLVSVRSEPRSFNRHAATDTTTDLVSNLTQDKLVRINPMTQATEPSLAEAWTAAEDGRRFTIALRRGIVFSDGVPFTSDDVVFSFQAAYDEKSGSGLADSLEAGGRKLQVTATDPQTVVITFPAPFAT